MASTNMRT
jgi:hypothetical protein